MKSHAVDADLIAVGIQEPVRATLVERSHHEGQGIWLQSCRRCDDEHHVATNRCQAGLQSGRFTPAMPVINPIPPRGHEDPTRGSVAAGKAEPETAAITVQPTSLGGV